MTTPAKAHKMILLLLFFSFSAQILLSQFPIELIIAVGQVFSLLIPLILYLALTGGGYGERLGLKTFKSGDMITGIGVTLLLQPFLMLLATVVESIAGNPMEPLVETLTSTPAWITVIGLALMPAFIEELVFRGALLGSYRRMPLWAAALLNGAVFGMFHMNLYQFSYAMILGIFFSVTTRRCGSVFPAMIMHFINNLISVILIYQLDSKWYGVLEDALVAGTTPGLGLLAGISVGAVSLGAAYWLQQKTAQTAVFEGFYESSAVDSGRKSSNPDWALMLLCTVFVWLTLVQPISEFLKGM